MNINIDTGKTFISEFNRALAHFQKRGIAVLATTDGSRVTARTISILTYKNKIFFQTSSNLDKYKQINENPHVAVCLDSIQIEGIAVQRNHPLAEKIFIGLHKEKHYSFFVNYSHMQSSRVIEIFPKKMKIWEYKENESYIITLNIDETQIIVESYQHSLTD